MAHTLKKFTEHTEYEEFMENPPVKNTVSICKEEEHVHYDEAPIFYDKLVFDGVAWIDTGYVLPENCSIAGNIGEEIQKKEQQIWGASEAGKTTYIVFGGATTNIQRQVVPAYQSASYLISDQYLRWDAAIGMNLFQTPKGFGYGNFFRNYTKGSVIPTISFKLGRASMSEVAKLYTGKIRTIKIYGSDAQNVNKYDNFAPFTPIATFKPCIYKGKAGMWFVEEGRFCGNAASSGILTVENI